MAAYPFQDIEKKWQAHWEEHKTFRTPEAPDPEKPKFYVLDMFPYPSGSGLHVGHPEGYTATDIVARYKRMQGFKVLHPMGWDAFGLPAEQYAVETGTHPRETTERNIARFREQLKSLGFSYDWDREVNTTDPKYYRWTQWIFLKLYERGLAYQAEVPVWWCEELGTVLANEEVIDGKSERGGYPCERVPMRQWMLKITDYADRLLEGLDELDWPDSTKEMQRNWIGRSEGAEVEFPVVSHPEERIKAFTTRPDTLFGATYMVLAPEHPLVPKVTDADHFEAVDSYIREAAQKTELERTELQKEKSGVFTGGHAVNPVNGEKIPIWVADYVLATYGTGAIMAVPAHDERDYDFARTFDLPIREVVQGGDISKGAYVENEGLLVNSDSSDRPIDRIAERGVSINGLSVEEAQEKIVDWLEEQGVGRGRVNYKLRDWLFSRQRYWGEPFPIIHVDGAPKPVPEEDLPVELPDVESYDQFEEVMTPLSAVPEWVEATDPETGEPAERETNTMPQWAGSCWYYLRFIDPHNDEQLVDPEKEKYWMPVDLYIGGSEHAVLHLLYARFWHKVLYDAGVVSTKEPFRKLIHQGLILGEMEHLIVVKKKEFENWMAERGVTDLQGQALVDETLDELPPREILLPREVAEGEGARRPHRLAKVEADEVEKRGDNWVLKKYPEIEVIATSHKMSKSRGNVVNPDEIVDEYGADALRLYEMFMGPLEQVKPWSTSDVEGVYRFLNRAWRLIAGEGEGPLAETVEETEPAKEQRRLLHETIREVTEDIEDLRFNTAIARMMEFVNAANKWDVVPKAVAGDFVLLLSPFAPHLSEELWQRLGHEETLAYEPWPAWEEEYLKREVVEMAVQVNGTVRGTIEIEAEAEEGEVLEKARAEENVARHLNGRKVQREIYVPGRIVNFVAE